MEQRYSHRNPREVRRQNTSQYENLWNGYADTRRALYPYEVSPYENREPYNIWEDIADNLNPSQTSLIYEFGANDGYFHSILRKRGFTGRYVGIDIEGKDLPAVEIIARQRFPNAQVDFIQGDAQNLKGLIENDSVPAVAVNFVTYHAEKPSRILSELYRVLMPDGIGVVSSRGVSNQLDTWEIARWVAHSHGFAFPEELDPNDNTLIKGVRASNLTVYSHFDIDQTRRTLRDSKKFEIINEKIQDSTLWIPTDNDIGLHDLESVVESLLPYTISMKDRSKPTAEDISIMYEFITQHMRHYFIVSGLKNQQELNLPTPYYLSRAHQGFFVVRARK